MRDARKEIVTALKAAINTKLPTRTVYTVPPKQITGITLTYPYIFISDIYQEENGPKNQFYYSYEVLIQVVYKEITSKVNLWSDVNSILTIVNSKRDLTLTNNFSLMQIQLIANSEEKILTDKGTLNVGLIRLRFDVEDNL